jgi:hypothetical protein
LVVIFNRCVCVCVCVCVRARVRNTFAALISVSSRQSRSNHVSSDVVESAWVYSPFCFPVTIITWLVWLHHSSLSVVADKLRWSVFVCRRQLFTHIAQTSKSHSTDLLLCCCCSFTTILTNDLTPTLFLLLSFVRHEIESASGSTHVFNLHIDMTSDLTCDEACLAWHPWHNTSITTCTGRSVPGIMAVKLSVCCDSFKLRTLYDHSAVVSTLCFWSV